MRQIYSSPLRVYMVLGLLALVGVFSGINLPISLYPNSNKPTIWTSLSYGNLTSEEFLHNYGQTIEAQLESIDSKDLVVEKVTGEYSTTSVWFKSEFAWGADPKEALKEVQSVMNGLSGRWPKEVRDSLNVNYWSKSSGFIAISFFSEERSLNDLYKILEPAIVPRLAKVKDAENPTLWNPGRKEVRIELNPEVMATLNLFPRDIQGAIDRGLDGYLGGSVVVGTSKLTIQMPRELNGLKELEELLIPTGSGKLVHLSEIARIDFGEASDSNNIFKTSGAKSLILFANPRTGGNVKEMAEQILEIVKEAMPSLPKDIQYRVLVDPSEFIRASVNNVIHEVFVAAGLAVLVLFLFIGSLRNTITAAIEIPLSMVLAFILMKMSGMNLNLISLGGLALAAGMNVDASVVVMENIFRHLENAKGQLDISTRLNIIVRAVKEVRMPIIASTISTLVVFAPLAFTSDLTNAILGDLAKAVVFSHGFSMFIALILVPTIRLQLIKAAKGEEVVPKAPIEGLLKSLEQNYSAVLRGFINSRFLKWAAVTAVPVMLVVVLVALVPGLRREIIGLPDTDWMIVSVSTSGNTKVQQMETDVGKIESELLAKFGNDIMYTFTQIRGANRGTIMARLKDKHDMERVWKALEENFQNTPTLYFWVGPWNPAELPIPDPPQMRLLVRGGNVEDRDLMAKDLMDRLREKEPFPRTWSDPGVGHSENIVIRPHLQRWPELQERGAKFMPFDLTDLSRVATEGRIIGDINITGESYPMQLKYPSGFVTTKEDLEAMPIGVGEKMIALSAIADVKLEKAKPAIFRENGRDLIVIQAKQDKGKEFKVEASLAAAKKLVEEYKKEDKSYLGMTSHPQLIFEDALKDMNQALEQLGVAVGLSVLLIMFTLLMQFGSLVHTLIIMVAIPLGISGGVFGLWLFGSTLSLNSVLGIILLNGIAVNNSIILVDFLRTLVDEGMTPIEAAVTAARKRLRPILITSLTTILGMLPIALGSGEGGKILQPLGISVAGGLWFSMLCTLFVVPLLEVMYLNWKLKRRPSFPRPPKIEAWIETEEMPHEDLATSAVH